MSKVYLHIGMPKTGTSALQMFLPKNNEILHKYGFDYPLMPFRFKNVGPRRNAHFLTLWKEKDPAPEWKKGFSVVKESLTKYENVILSDENIWTQQRKENFWEEVTAGMSAIGAELVVIVYLRRQDEQVESNWNQKVKDQKTRIELSFADFMEQGGYRYMPFQYGNALDRISSYVGREHLVVRVYEKQQFVAGNLFADFLDVLGLGFSDEYLPPDFTANVRLPNSAVEIKRMINSAYRDEDVPDFYRDIISRVFGMKSIQEMPERDTSMFSREQRESFMKEFEEGNTYVAREYLGRSDGVLFRQDASALKQWQMDDHEILMDMIRIFAAEGVTLYKRQMEIDQREKALNERLDRLEKAGIFKFEAIAKKVEEIYNSMPFRAYRKLRDRKDGK